MNKEEVKEMRMQLIAGTMRVIYEKIKDFLDDYQGPINPYMRYYRCAWSWSQEGIESFELSLRLLYRQIIILLYYLYDVGKGTVLHNETFAHLTIKQRVREQPAKYLRIHLDYSASERLWRINLCFLIFPALESFAAA